MAVNIDVIGGTHGNELVGTAIAFLLEHGPPGYRIPTVRSCLADTEAAKQGVRFLGARGIDEYYPGIPEGTQVEREAYETLRWLGASAGSEQVLVYDVHDNIVPNNTFCTIGRRALQAGLVGGSRLVHTNRFLLAPTSFAKSVPNAVTLELQAVTLDEHIDVIDRFFEELDTLATDTTIDELQQEYIDIADTFKFYSKHTISTKGHDGQIADYMPELEQIPSPGAFMPVDLPPILRKQLDISDKADEILAGTWGHDNMSKLNARLGCTADGTPRREYFGCFMVPIDPPVKDGPWVEFLDGI
jgi:hypothetical protein